MDVCGVCFDSLLLTCLLSPNAASAVDHLQNGNGYKYAMGLCVMRRKSMRGKHFKQCIVRENISFTCVCVCVCVCVCACVCACVCMCVCMCACKGGV